MSTNRDAGRTAVRYALAGLLFVAWSGCRETPPPTPPPPKAPAAAASTVPVKTEQVAMAGNAASSAMHPAADVVPAAADSTSEPAEASVAAESPPEPQPGERLLLLAPGGPLIVEIHVTIDGQPFTAMRETLIDELLRMGQRDGQSLWAAAIEHPRFAGFEQAYGGATSGSDLDRQRRAYDRNADGRIDRHEAERFVSQATGGSPLVLESRRKAMSHASPIRRLLDADGDGMLTVEEWSDAPSRLRLHDLDADDLLIAAELAAVGVADPGQLSSLMNARPLSETEPRALQLGPNASWRSILYWLEEDYLAGGGLTRESFGNLPGLFHHLDLDEDGYLTRQELERLNTAKPHLELELRFGRSGVMGPGVSLLRADETLGTLTTMPLPGNAGLLVELPGLKVQLATRDLLPQPNYDQQSQSWLSQRDADNNGYLEADEAGSDPSGQIPGTFDDWDLDNDGRVYAAELADYLARQAPPVASRVRALIDDQDDSLFWILDSSGDGRLTPRELQSAAERFAQFDRNHDERLTSDELPVVVRALFERADRMNAGPMEPMQPVVGGRQVFGPRWFTAMDRNGDGDVSASEFLGTAQQFRHLDSNADDFIDSEEAGAASAGPSE